MNTKREKILQFVLSKSDAGNRLDVFLSQKGSQLSRSRLKRLIQERKVTVNGLVEKASRVLREGDRVRLEVPKPLPVDISPQDIPLHILYEDEDLLILNKSPEIVVHPSAGLQRGTLVNAVLHHCPNLSGVGGKMRPGIVHRLDKGTSGVLVVAKNDFSHRALAAQFQARSVEKIYHAFVWGVPRLPHGTISRPLGRHLKDRKKISSSAIRTREAVTEYRLLKSWGMISWMELKPKTGRTHQIRVHLAEMGHPVVGDPTYGKGRRQMASLPKDLQGEIKAYPFQLLHASRLTFVHPRTGSKVSFEAPLRKDMRDLLQRMNSWKPNEMKNPRRGKK